MLARRLSLAYARANSLIVRRLRLHHPRVVMRGHVTCS